MQNYYNKQNINFGENDFMAVHKRLEKVNEEWNRSMKQTAMKSKIGDDYNIKLGTVAKIFNGDFYKSNGGDAYRDAVLQFQATLGVTLGRTLSKKYDHRDKFCENMMKFLCCRSWDLGIDQRTHRFMVRDFMKALKIIADSNMLNKTLLQYLIINKNRFPQEIHNLVVEIINSSEKGIVSELTEKFKLLGFDQKDAYNISQNLADDCIAPYIENRIDGGRIRRIYSSNRIKSFLSKLYSLELDDKSNNTIVNVGKVLVSGFDEEGMKEIVNQIMFREGKGIRDNLDKNNKLTFDVLTEVALTWIEHMYSRSNLNEFVIKLLNGSVTRIREDRVDGMRYGKLMNSIMDMKQRRGNNNNKRNRGYDDYIEF